MDNGKVILGLLAGVAVGAILGILFAPDKGSETRRKIAEQGDGLADSLKEKLNGFINDMTDKLESAVNNTKDTSEKGQQP